MLCNSANWSVTKREVFEKTGKRGGGQSCIPISYIILKSLIYLYNESLVELVFYFIVNEAYHFVEIVEDSMLNKWLIQQKRQPLIYKFPVTDITELCIPEDGILDYLALTILAAHGDPQQIRDDYKLLLKDAEDNALHKLKGYLESHV